MKIDKIYEFHYGKYTELNYLCDNGLKIYYFPYDDFHSVNIGFLVPYGATMTNYVIDGKRVTPGVAHFLEHRMFDSSDGDLSEIYSSYGAYCNAWTSYDRTSFYFQTSFDYILPFRLLLRQINEFYSSEEQFEIERKIILEEAKSNLSSEGNVMFNNLMSALYKDNILNKTIIGSIKDIKSITLNEVKNAYSYFYDISKLSLVIVGRCDIGKIFDELGKFSFSQKESVSASYLPLKDDGALRKKYIYAKRDVVDSLDMIGFKEKVSYFDKKYGVYESCSLINAALEFCFTNGSKFYNDLIDERLIKGRMYPSYLTCDDDMMVSVSFNSNNIRKVQSRLRDLRNHPEKYISERKFDLFRKKEISSNIRTLEDISSWFDEIMFSLENNYNCLEYYSKNTKIMYNDIVKIVQDILSCPASRSHISIKKKGA